MWSTRNPCIILNYLKYFIKKRYELMFNLIHHTTDIMCGVIELQSNVRTRFIQYLINLTERKVNLGYKLYILYVHICR